MMAFEAGYQGGHSIHEFSVTEFNDALPGSTAPGSPSRQQRRPFPQLQSYRLVTANGDSKYNSLEMKLQRRAGCVRAFDVAYLHLGKGDRHGG